MNGFWAVYVKELRETFGTPIALVTVAVFWALSGYLFSFNLFFASTGQMVTAFHNMTLLLMLVTPLVSMRLFADENKTGTLELLLTMPITDSALVAGKYAAALTVLLLMLAGTAVAVVSLALFSRPDYGPIIGGYLGVALFGAVFLALGLAISSFCSHQVVAAMTTWGLLILLWFIDYPAALDIYPTLSPLFIHLSMSAQHVDFIRGVLPGASVVLFASIILLALFVTTRNLKMRRLR